MAPQPGRGHRRERRSTCPEPGRAGFPLVRSRGSRRLGRVVHSCERHWGRRCSLREECPPAPPRTPDLQVRGLPAGSMPARRLRAGRAAARARAETVTQPARVPPRRSRRRLPVRPRACSPVGPRPGAPAPPLGAPQRSAGVAAHRRLARGWPRSSREQGRGHHEEATPRAEARRRGGAAAAPLKRMAVRRAAPRCPAGRGSPRRW